MHFFFTELKEELFAHLNQISEHVDSKLSEMNAQMPCREYSIYADVLTQCLSAAPEHELLRQCLSTLLHILITNLSSTEKDLQSQSLKDLHTISCHLTLTDAPEEGNASAESLPTKRFNI